MEEPVLKIDEVKDESSKMEYLNLIKKENAQIKEHSSELSNCPLSLLITKEEKRWNYFNTGLKSSTTKIQQNSQRTAKHKRTRSSYILKSRASRMDSSSPKLKSHPKFINASISGKIIIRKKNLKKPPSKIKSMSWLKRSQERKSTFKGN